MRTLLTLAAGFAIAVLAVPLLANSAPTRQTDAITMLQHRVSALEHTTSSLRKQLAAQAKVNSATSARLSRLEGQVANVPAPKLTVSSAAGADASIYGQSSGSPSAACPGGTTLIGGAYKGDDQLEVSSSAPGTSANTWNFTIWNPSRSTAERTSVTPYAICLSLTP